MKINKITEANIDLNDLDKPGQGGLRGDILVKKIKDGEEILFNPKNGDVSLTKVVNSEEIIPNITDDKERYDSKKSRDFFKSGYRFKKIILGEDDVLYQLNDIEKTKDFSMKSGTSLGSVETRMVETIQCFFFSLRQKMNRDLKIDEIEDLVCDESLFNEVMENVRSKVILSLQDIVNYSTSWLESFVNTSNAMYSNVPVYTTDLKENILSRVKIYNFYHISYDDGISNILLNKYREFPESIGVPISKWTPSDVWAIDSRRESEVLSEVRKSTTISELNNVIDKYFDSKVLRGISLKKVKSKDFNIVINKVTPKPEYVFDRCIISKDPLTSLGIKIVSKRKSVYMGFDDEIMDLRIFSGSDNKPTDISGEIVGENARHGKIGLNKINDMIRKNCGHEFLIPVKAQLDLLSDDEIESEINTMNDSLIGYGASYGKTGPLKAVTRARLVSKYQSLKIGELLYTIEKDILDKLIKDIYYYALCIENDQFESPKYVRII
jgi:hypothetical protein